MVGTAVANDLVSEQEFAKAIGVRYRVGQHLIASLTYVDEGDTWGDRRKGVAAQVWLEDALNERASVGVGIGPYFLTDRPRFPDGEKFPSVSMMISVTAAYAMTPRSTARFVWNRVSTNYDRDTDVVLFAVGYRF